MPLGSPPGDGPMKINMMHKTSSRTALCWMALSALGFSLTLGNSATAAQHADLAVCQSRSVADLHRLSARGYAVYEALADKKQFLTWISCDDPQTELSTAVHETVHLLTAENDAYVLLDGSMVHRPHEVSRFFPPKNIARRFDTSDSYVQNYLRPGGASSNDDFMYLLDELNAYSHDLDTAVSLVPLQKHDRIVDHRDGLAALMTFVMAYVDDAAKAQPATWQGLQQSEPKKAVQVLWSQAETTLASSCGLPEFGMHDRDYIAYLCEKKNAGGLADLLGRAPFCPTECLVPQTTSSISSTHAR
jgi:hypothetical protein